MRKIFLIGLLFSALFTSAQPNWTNTTPIGGNTATLSTVRGGFRPDGGFVNKSFADTAAANAAIGMSLNAGSQFYNTTTGTIWYRNNMNMWVEGAATTIYQGTRLVSGSASYSNVGLDYNVTNCVYFILGVGYTSVATTVTLAVANPSLPRKDVIYVDDNGLVGVLTGTPSANPEKPQVNPLTQLEITFVDINAGATTPTGVTVTTIYDENVEWGGSSDVVGINFAYATNPYSGTVSTYVPAASDGTYIKWTNSSTLDITDNQYLKFYIRLNGSLTGSPTAFLTISFFNVTTQTTQDFIVANGSYGFNSSTLNAYQLVVIPIYPPFNTNNFDNVKFVLNGAPSTSFQLDKIYLVSGSSLPPPATPIAWNVTGLNDIASNPLAGIGTSSYDDFRIYTNNTLIALFSKDGITQSTDTVHKQLILDTATGRFYWDYRPSIFTDSPLYKYVVNEKNHIAADTTDANPKALATQYDLTQLATPTWQQTLTAGSVITSNINSTSPTGRRFVYKTDAVLDGRFTRLFIDTVQTLLSHYSATYGTSGLTITNDTLASVFYTTPSFANAQVGASQSHSFLKYLNNISASVDSLKTFGLDNNGAFFSYNNQRYTFPLIQPITGQYLGYNGDTRLEWLDLAAAGNNNEVQINRSGVFGADSLFTADVTGATDLSYVSVKSPASNLSALHVYGATGQTEKIFNVTNKNNSTQYFSVSPNSGFMSGSWVLSNGGNLTISSAGVSENEYIILNSNASARDYSLTINGTTEAFNIKDKTSGVNRVTVDSLGKVGINDTTPDSTLSIAGGLQINNGRAASNYVWTSTGTDGGGDWKVNNAASASTLTTPRKINGVSFNGSANISVDIFTKAYQSLGSTIIAQNVDGTLADANSALIMVSQRSYWSLIYLPVDTVLTGVKWKQSTQGNYTANNYNGVGLYSISGGTLTLVASSTNDGDIWKATGSTIASKAFSSTYSAQAGVYMVAALHSSSSSVQSPIIGQLTGLSGFINAIYDFTNSAKTAGLISSLTALPSPTQAFSGITASGNQAWFAVY